MFPLKTINKNDLKIENSGKATTAVSTQKVKGRTGMELDETEEETAEKEAAKADSQEIPDYSFVAEKDKKVSRIQTINGRSKMN